MPDQPIKIFMSASGQARLEVALEHETVWFNQSQVAVLFSTPTDSVGLHLKHILEGEELQEAATSEEFFGSSTGGTETGSSSFKARQVRRNYHCALPG